MKRDGTTGVIDQIKWRKGMMEMNEYRKMLLRARKWIEDEIRDIEGD